MRLDEGAPRPGGGVKPASGEAANVDGINRDVGFVAGVNGSRHLRPDLGIEREAGGEQDQGLTAGDVRQVLGQTSQGKHHAARAIIGRGSAQTGHADRGDLDIGGNGR